MLATFLAGCSALRLSYANGPQLAWWWLDGYFDFDGNQTPVVKASIERWFDWHRTQELPRYAAQLSALAARADRPLDAAEVCRLSEQIRRQLDPAIDQALRALAQWLPSLGEAQFRHLEQRYAKTIDEMRDEHLQPDPAERRRRSVERTTERFEQIYGRLGDAQRQMVAAGVAASPFDAQAWIEERRERQRDTVQMLRRLGAEKADTDRRLAALRALVERSDRSPDPGYRAYQQTLADYNCAFVARVHNATTPAQRAHARDTLEGWADDLRFLMRPPAALPTDSTPG